MPPQIDRFPRQQWMDSICQRLVRHSWRLRSRFVFESRIAVDGQGWAIPIVQGQGDLHLKPAEQWMTHLVRRLAASRRGTFLDVGANLGQTLLHVRAAVPDLPYVA